MITMSKDEQGAARAAARARNAEMVENSVRAILLSLVENTETTPASMPVDIQVPYGNKTYSINDSQVPRGALKEILRVVTAKIRAAVSEP